MRTHERRQARPRQPSSDPARLKAFGIQARLRVNAPGDVYEQEAERIAAKVTRMPEPAVQRTCSCGGECPDCKAKHLEEEAVQTRSIDEADFGSREAPASVQEALRAPGRPLDRSTETFFSSRFRHDFRNVRVHTDEAAERSARELRASAYTVGRDIVFAPGQYAPGTDEGRRLLAHELTHVVQQRGWAGVVQREDKIPDLEKAKKPETIDDVAKPIVTMLEPERGKACACLVVIHNDEKKARETAKDMRDYCSFNLLLVEPNTKQRNLKLPGGTEIDPNSLFPGEIMKECIGKESCPPSNDDTTEVRLQKQYFMAVQECSDTFNLPVVALHNNTFKDTNKKEDRPHTYLEQIKLREEKKQKNKLGEDELTADDLKMHIEKRRTEPGAPTLENLKSRLKNFDLNLTDLIGEEGKSGGMTNIFRWCISEDLSSCHIGDPKNPDDVIWVTNRKDFEALSNADVNVAYQSEIPKDERSSDSATDLSTLFLFIHHHRIQEKVAELTPGLPENLRELIENPRLLTGPKGWLKLLEILGQLDVLLPHIPDELRYVNIETGGKRKSERRKESDAFIAKALEALGLQHCCAKPQEEESEKK